MILTCPACGTRYTVKDGAIPPGGRQVRCANCKHSWHQDPEVAADEPATAVPVAADPTASDTPAATSHSHPRGEERGQGDEAGWSDHAHPDAVATGQYDDPDASPLPEPQPAAVEQGWRESDAPAEPQTVTSEEGSYEVEPVADEPVREREPLPYAVAHDPGLATPALPSGEAGWVAPAAVEPVTVDFTPYDRGEEFSGGKGRALIGLLAALVLIAVAVVAFWFLAPTSFKQRLGLAEVTQTPLKLQVDQQSRRTLASGQQVLEVSGKVINPSDQVQSVPPLQAQLRSLDQQVVYRWTIPPPAPTLQPGGSASFNSAELNIPASAACLDVSLDKDKPSNGPCREANKAG